MDFVRLLNEGKRSEPIVLSLGAWRVERAEYTHPEYGKVSVIEKWNSLPGAREHSCSVDRQAERLRSFSALGLNTPLYIASSGDPGMARRPGRDLGGPDRLFLEDLTSDGCELLDLFGVHGVTEDARCTLMGGNRISSLMNREQVRETLASHMAIVALDGAEPTADYFMVRVAQASEDSVWGRSGTVGKVYLVDVEQEPPYAGSPSWHTAKSLYLDRSGIGNPERIVARMQELVREYHREGIPRRRVSAQRVAGEF